MKFKLEAEHKHILRLIDKGTKPDGWASVSKKLYPILAKNMSIELAEFKMIGEDGRVRLTEEGREVVRAMSWL